MRSPALSTELPASRSQLPASSSQLPASSSQLPASSSQLPASGFQLPASSFALPASSRRLVRKNAGASLIEMGDGGLQVEFHSKMNAIGGDTSQRLDVGDERTGGAAHRVPARRRRGQDERRPPARRRQGARAATGARLHATAAASGDPCRR